VEEVKEELWKDWESFVLKSCPNMATREGIGTSIKIAGKCAIGL
jgi:hypothetical protein